MNIPETLASIEIEIVAALAKFGADMTPAERRAFRLGFVIGARHVLDLASEEIRNTWAKRK